MLIISENKLVQFPNKASSALIRNQTKLEGIQY